MISITGQKEAPWGDTITFRGDAITYRFVAEADGKVGAANPLATSDPQEDDWGFRFTVSEHCLLVLQTAIMQNRYVFTGLPQCGIPLWSPRHQSCVIKHVCTKTCLYR